MKKIKRIYLTLCLFVFAVLIAQAQNYPKNPNKIDASGKRQGTWTLFFDWDWNAIPATSDRIAYYRVITYKDDKPTGIVRDYYKSGAKQFEGTMLADRPEEILDGNCTFYNEKGIKTQISSYKQGKFVSTTYYDAQGKVITNNQAALTDEADKLFEEKKYKEAFALYEKARSLAASESGKVSIDYAKACENYSFCMVKLTENDANKLIEAHKEPLEIYEKLGAQKSIKYARAAYNLASIAQHYKQNDLAEKHYLKAKTTLEEINQTEENFYESIKANLLVLYDNLKQYNKAEPLCEDFLKRLEKNGKKETKTYTKYLYKLARYQKLKGKYTEAEKMMNEVISINAKILNKEKQKNYSPKVVKNIPQSIKKTNLGKNINTTYNDISPFVSADGKTLYFSRKNSPENTGGEKDFDEIYYSELQTDGSWGKAKNAGKPLNNTGPNFVISVTPDNNTVLVGGTYKPDGSPGGSGVSLSVRGESGWQVPKKVEIKNDYNKSKYVSYNLSADGKTLLMAVQRDDSRGDLDLYVAFLQEDGTFSEPKSLGNTINTFSYESNPFLAPDGTTLYFATSGYPTYGSTDIFVSKRLDDTWQNWSEPENLGHEINTENEDGGFVLDASGQKAYMVSSAESIGGMDIVQIELPDVLRPKAVVLVSGRVINAKTKQPIAARITYRDLETDTELGVANSSPVDGSYKIILPSGNAYSFLAEKKGFIATSNNLNLEQLSTYKEIQQDLLLSPIEIGQTVRLNNIFFDTGKWELREESTAELKRLVKILNENPTMAIEIAGHTDNVGNTQKNLQLSQNRADAVKNYLQKNGVAANRLSSKGYGQNKPVAANNTEEGRQTNRRVEFSILK